MLRLTIVDGTHQAALTLFDAAKKSWDVLYLNLLKQKKKKKQVQYFEILPNNKF